MPSFPNTDLQRDLGSSIAVKITAPFLWIIIIIGVAIAVFLQSNIKSELSAEINYTADYLAYELQSRLNKTQWELVVDDRLWLREQLETTPMQAITLTIGNKIISIGEGSDGWETLERKIIRDNRYWNNENNVAIVRLKHPALDELIKAYRRELLIKAGIPFLVFSIILASLIHYSVTRPIAELVEATQAVTKGDLSKRISSVRHDEFGHLGQFLNKMLDKLQEQQQQLSKAVIAAEAASTAKSSFLANMSHEIRTPLTAIIGFSEVILERGLVDKKSNQELEAVIRSGAHLQEIINDILDFSKIEAGQLVIESMRVSPIRMLEDISSLFIARAEDKGLKFNIKIEYPFPKEIITDPTRFKQIIINLCSNAIKFTEIGSVSMLAKYASETNKLFVSITDTGIGMDEEEQKHIFLPFTQADASISRKFGGTGLGLCISNELAEKLGGSIRCNSRKTVGTQFMLEIDAGKNADKEMIFAQENFEQQRVEADQPESRTMLQGRVLLAEDNIDNQRLLGFYLERAGVDYVVAENGEMAVRFIMSESFDLVLMDMQMPVMDGLTAIKLLRKQGFKKPIVVLTANVLAENRSACEEAGANDFLTKPINVKRINAMLEKYLSVDIV